MVLPLSVVKRKVRLDNRTTSRNEISRQASRAAGAFGGCEVMPPDDMEGGIEVEGVEQGCNIRAQHISNGTPCIYCLIPGRALITPFLIH